LVNFDKIERMITLISNSEIEEGQTFNEFAIDFYLETRKLPLSKYLRMQNNTKKMPKIMNTKKAGEILFFSEKDPEAIRFLQNQGYRRVPELNYTAVMLVRKTDLINNWKKILSYFEGKGTIEEINNSTRSDLLPEERKKMKSYIKDSLELSETELDWLQDKFKLILSNKEIMRSIKRIIR